MVEGTNRENNGYSRLDSDEDGTFRLEACQQIFKSRSFPALGRVDE